MGAPTLTIRPFQSNDRAVVREIFAQGLLDFAGDYLPQVNNYIRESLDDDLADISANYLEPPGSCFWVAELDGKIKGMVGIQHRTDDEAELRRMSVAGDARGQGIARRLLETAEDFCRKWGYARIRLITDVLLETAIALYRKNGYRIVADETSGNVPGYRFVKELNTPD